MKMKIGIVGGALQGMEAVLLAKKAGYESLVIDRKSTAPAASLADHFVLCDVVNDTETAKRIFSDCDAVIPACEELDALHILCKEVPAVDKPLLFDMHAYEISCSKERSNRIMAEAGVPLPKPWPECGFPIIVKPSCQSGSIGVSEVNNEEERQKALEVVKELGDEPIQQEFVSGNSVSIEVIGNGTSARSYVTTEIVLDHNYDCKRVVCEPNILKEEDDELFGKIGVDIANGIGLKALMDVEAIYTKNGLRVLEIDSRIPSQTPMAIQAGTGINLLEELVNSALGKGVERPNSGNCSVYEHYLVRDGNLITCGEKEFGHVEKPYIAERLFGADEVITDYMPGKSVWRATVINSGKTPAEVLEKRKRFISNAMNECDLEEYIDRSPEVV
jgi:pyrrolysine biosynthesis protein PylC